ncbi:MAG: inositol monophosphatase family protein [Acidobacteriota bacterium]
MSLTNADLQYLAEVAASAAREAGAMIARSRPTRIDRKEHTGGERERVSLASQLVTDVDRRSETLLLGHLEPTRERYGLGLLTEERDDDRSRLTAEYFWCVDPLDGTLPFTEGVPGYAVSIALVARNGVSKIGVVCDPLEGTVLHAVAGAGTFRDGRPWSGDSQGTGDVLTVFADRSFPATDEGIVQGLEGIAHELGLSGVHMRVGAGAVMNGCGVLGKPPACYLKFPKPSGGGSLWDFAATSCLLRESGAVASDILGAPLDLNRADSTFMNHRGVLFATDEALAERLRALRPIDG